MITAARKRYIKLLKWCLPKNIDNAPLDLLALLDAAHAEWHRLLGTDWVALGVPQLSSPQARQEPK